MKPCPECENGTPGLVELSPVSEGDVVSDPTPTRNIGRTAMESDLNLYTYNLSEDFWVVVADGEDPIETLVRHCPDELMPEDLPGYWDRDEWPEDWGEEEQFDHLLTNVEATRYTGDVPLDWDVVNDLGILPEGCEDMCVDVPADDLLRVSKHGDMWSTRWAE